MTFTSVVNPDLWSKIFINLIDSLNPSTASHFSAAFKDSLLFSVDDSCDLSAEELTKLSLPALLETAAPLRYKGTKTLGEPWLNDTGSTTAQV